jgi:hypothetical protein
MVRLVRATYCGTCAWTGGPDKPGHDDLGTAGGDLGTAGADLGAVGGDHGTAGGDPGMASMGAL